MVAFTGRRGGTLAAVVEREFEVGRGYGEGRDRRKGKGVDEVSCYKCGLWGRPCVNEIVLSSFSTRSEIKGACGKYRASRCSVQHHVKYLNWVSYHKVVQSCISFAGAEGIGKEVMPRRGAMSHGALATVWHIKEGWYDLGVR